jgi:hypothetical protein
MLLAGRGACIFGSRNAPPSVTRPLQGYARAKILAVRLSRDEMHASMFKATVYEIFRLEAFSGRKSTRKLMSEIKIRFLEPPRVF